MSRNSKEDSDFDEVQRTAITLDVEHLEEEKQLRRYGEPESTPVYELTVGGRASHLVISRPGEDMPFYSCVPSAYDGEETRFEFGPEAFDYLDEGKSEAVQIVVFSVGPATDSNPPTEVRDD